eukprot:7321610-Prymnesium_polylepis.1
MPLATQAAPAEALPVTSRPAALQGCLITKWASIWLVHANRTRSHVSTPSEDCDAHALEIVDDGMINGLDKYPKAHGGEGLYALSPALSAAACRLGPCAGPAGAAKPKTDGDGLRMPPNGWGMGVVEGWTEI